MCVAESQLKQSAADDLEGRLMKIPSCEILGFRCDVDNVTILLGCEAVSHPRRMDNSKFRVYGT